MANIKKEGKFEDATNEWIRIHDVIDFVDKEYGIIYINSNDAKKIIIIMFVLIF